MKAMNQEAVQEAVCQIVAAALQKSVTELTAQASHDTEATWDSLAQLRIIAGLEEAFAMEFSDEEVTALASVAQLTTAVLSYQERG